jgi:hypothetical protein
MIPCYIAIAPKKGDWHWITIVHTTIDDNDLFVVHAYPHSPTGVLKHSLYDFKRLTEIEFESYIEIGALEFQDPSKYIVVIEQNYEQHLG